MNDASTYITKSKTSGHSREKIERRDLHHWRKDLLKQLQETDQMLAAIREKVTENLETSGAYCNQDGIFEEATGWTGTSVSC